MRTGKREHFVMVTKSNRLGWAEHVTRQGDTSNVEENLNRLTEIMHLKASTQEDSNNADLSLWGRKVDETGLVSSPVTLLSVSGVEVLGSNTIIIISAMTSPPSIIETPLILHLPAPLAWTTLSGIRSRSKCAIVSRNTTSCMRTGPW